MSIFRQVCSNNMVHDATLSIITLLQLSFSLAWRHIPVIPALRRQREAGGHKVKSSLCSSRPHLKQGPEFHTQNTCPHQQNTRRGCSQHWNKMGKFMVPNSRAYLEVQSQEETVSKQNNTRMTPQVCSLICTCTRAHMSLHTQTCICIHTHARTNINISKSWSKFELALVTIWHDAPNCNIPSNLKHLLLGVSQQLLKMETEQPKCHKK